MPVRNPGQRSHSGKVPETEQARQVAEKFYGLEVGSAEHLPEGRVNLTFLMRTADGRRFILQRLHDIFGSQGEAVENAAAAADCLAAAGLPAPCTIRTAGGCLWAETGGIWRLLQWLPGRTAGRRTMAVGVEAARLLGRFHQALADNPPVLKPLPPAEHSREGPIPISDWHRLIETRRRSPKFDAAARLLDRGTALAGRLPAWRPVTRTVVHGDPKLENFLFDESGRAVGLIDLDIVRNGALLWELADALRSWAASRKGRELLFQKDIFTASARAYRETGLVLAPEEWPYLPAAVTAVTLNLGLRYLTDYFDEKYFVWDRAGYSSLAEQNLTRGRAYLEMAEDLSAGQEELAALVGGC